MCFGPHSASINSSPPLCWPTRITPAQRLLGGKRMWWENGSHWRRKRKRKRRRRSSACCLLLPAGLLEAADLTGADWNDVISTDWNANAQAGDGAGKAPWHSHVCWHSFPGQAQADAREEMKRCPSELSMMVPPIPVLPALAQQCFQ